jgi:hypothetical protein
MLVYSEHGRDHFHRAYVEPLNLNVSSTREELAIGHDRL